MPRKGPFLEVRLKTRPSAEPIPDCFLRMLETKLNFQDGAGRIVRRWLSRQLYNGECVVPQETSGCHGFANVPLDQHRREHGNLPK